MGAKKLSRFEEKKITSLDQVNFMSIKGVMEKTGYGRTQVLKLIADGKLKGKKLNNGKIAIFVDSFLQFLNSSPDL